MTDELANKLYLKYEDILFTYDKSSKRTIKTHLDVDDGWYDIIDVLCNNIQHHQKNSKDFTPIKALQIKEKFGELRFYTLGGDEYCRGVILTAEAMSRKICEVCGNKGTLRQDGWMRTLCDTHEDERRWRNSNEPKTILPNSG